MNWDDAKNGDAADCLDEGWRDAWVELGSPSHAKATCYWSRLDRVFFCSNPTAARACTLARPRGIAPSGVSLLGSHPTPALAGLTYEAKSGKRYPLKPSDHAGLCVTFTAASGDSERA